MYPEIQELARYLARLVQGSQQLEGAGLDEAGYTRLITFAENHIQEKWSVEMRDLISKWDTSALSLEQAAAQTDEIRHQRYGNHFVKLKKDQRREFQRLQAESERLRGQAAVYRKCASELTVYLAPEVAANGTY